MRRVIIDTNLWLSALLKAPLRQRLETVLFHSDVQIVVSTALMEELTEVAARPKFKRYFTVEQAT
ncbi:MAG: putative toxin-antitoxin system toxin component, PIN family [Cytophagaceae bacterium]|nr:putative toxin-antitoxin system toxin component, PIN family [Cytophagaceae bacterium]